MLCSHVSTPSMTSRIESTSGLTCLKMRFGGMSFILLSGIKIENRSAYILTFFWLCNLAPVHFLLFTFSPISTRGNEEKLIEPEERDEREEKDSTSSKCSNEKPNQCGIVYNNEHVNHKGSYPDD